MAGRLAEKGKGIMTSGHFVDKVLIAIPVYNEARFIRETIESALAQGTQILVSDNASTDGTSEICQEYAKKGDISYIRHLKNMGVWRNFCYTAEQAAVPYFMWLGGHDVLPADYIVTMMEAAAMHRDAVLFCPSSIEWLDENGNMFEKECLAFDNLTSRRAFSRVWSAIQLTHGCFCHGLFRREAVRSAFSLMMNENTASPDMPFLWSVAAAGRFQAVDCTYCRRSFRQLESFRDTIRRQVKMLDLENVSPLTIWRRFRAFMFKAIDILENHYVLSAYLERILLKLYALHRYRFMRETVLSLDGGDYNE